MGNWFSVSVLVMFAATFFGNFWIGIAHGLILIGLLIGLVTRRFKWRSVKRLRASTWFLLAFALVSVISVVVNWETHAAPVSAIKKLRYLLIVVLLLIYSEYRSRAFASIKYRTACNLVWWTVLVVASVFGIVQYIWRSELTLISGVGYVGRVSGFYGQVTTFAYTLQFSVVALGILFFEKATFLRLSKVPWIWVVPVGLLSGITQYFAYSRGALLAVVVSVFFYLLLSKRWLMIGIMVLLGVAVGTVSYNDPRGSSETPRYFSFTDPVRVNQWRLAALTTLDNPLLGVGYKNFETQSIELKELYNQPYDIVKEEGPVHLQLHAHNNYLEAFAATGLIGGFLFAGFCFFWWREVSENREQRKYWWPLILTFLVSGLFENTFYDSEVMSCILLIYVCSQISLDTKVVRQGSEN
ncbi:MAG: O-antigen ligase family protein [Verrucomicrobiota bacterium]